MGNRHAVDDLVEHVAGTHRSGGLFRIGLVVPTDIHGLALNIIQFLDDGVLIGLQRFGDGAGQFGKLENSDNGGLENDMRAFDRYFTGCSFQGGTYDDSESPNKKFNAKDYHSGYGTSVIGNK